MKPTYHPLICINYEEQHYAPSFPSDKKEQMQYFDYYLTRISNKTYQLCSNKPKTYSEYKNFIIDCPKCGEQLEIMGLATNYYLLSTYMCTNYKEDF